MYILLVALKREREKITRNSRKPWKKQLCALQYNFKDFSQCLSVGLPLQPLIYCLFFFLSICLSLYSYLFLSLSLSLHTSSLSLYLAPSLSLSLSLSLTSLPLLLSLLSLSLFFTLYLYLSLSLSLSLRPSLPLPLSLSPSLSLSAISPYLHLYLYYCCWQQIPVSCTSCPWSLFYLGVTQPDIKFPEANLIVPESRAWS